jgi:hypothetical protein
MYAEVRRSTSKPHRVVTSAISPLRRNFAFDPPQSKGTAIHGRISKASREIALPSAIFFVFNPQSEIRNPKFTEWPQEPPRAPQPRTMQMTAPGIHGSTVRPRPGCATCFR